MFLYLSCAFLCQYCNDVALLTRQVASSQVNKYCVETLGYPKKNMEFRHGFIEDIAAAGIEVPAVHQCMLVSPSN